MENLICYLGGFGIVVGIIIAAFIVCVLIGYLIELIGLDIRDYKSSFWPGIIKLAGAGFTTAWILFVCGIIIFFFYKSVVACSAWIC